MDDRRRQAKCPAATRRQTSKRGQWSRLFREKTHGRNGRRGIAVVLILCTPVSSPGPMWPLRGDWTEMRACAKPAPHMLYKHCTVQVLCDTVIALTLLNCERMARTDRNQVHLPSRVLVFSLINASELPRRSYQPNLIDDSVQHLISESTP
ncbi:hypothetical protein VTN96DRAFT_8403 [Rasamsonia emersonii]